MILVTGAGGFLGGRVVSLLREQGVDVIPIRRGAQPRIDGDEWACDLTSRDHVDALSGAGVSADCLIHLAGHVEIALSPDGQGGIIPGEEDVSALYVGNVLATANVVRLARALGIGHVVFASSQTVYGRPETPVVTEDAPCLPLEHYAASKVAAESLLRLETERGLDVTALRIPGLYGGSRAGGVVRKFCRDAVHKGAISVGSEIDLPFDVLHVEDAARGVVAAATGPAKGWRCLNLSTGEPCSLTRLAGEVASLVDGCTVARYGVPQRDLTLDCERARREIDWQPVSRKERLQRMIDEERTMDGEQA